MRADTEWLRSLIRDLPDHPAPGIVFRDIAPTKDARGGRTTVKDSRDRYA